MSRSVIVLGGGGHARVVIDALLAGGRQVLGIVDPKSDLTLPAGVRRLGADLSGLRPAEAELALGIGSVDVGEKNPRPRLFLEGNAAGFTFVVLRHPSAVVAGDVVLGEGAQIMAGAIIQTGARIGRNVIVNTRASVDHDCRIGDHVHIAPGVILSGGVEIGAGAHLGTGAIVVQGIVIGAEAMIGAGALVRHPVAPGARVKADSQAGLAGEKA
jgi:sugar O-acyltransferase (sialic acid O-acetyltransferase NeuD family)